MRVRALGRLLPIESVIEGIVRRLARREKFKVTPLGLSPQIKIAAHKFGSLIDPYRLRVGNLGTNLLKCGNDVFWPVVEPWIDDGIEERKGVYNR